jgi:hypothetical protein
MRYAQSRRRGILARTPVAVCLALCGALSTGAMAADLSYLQGLLAATPEGGWVKASVGTYSDAWVTGAAALPNESFTNPGSVVRAWSSFAWDSTRGNLILWGGGHSNYIGNEIYLWQGSSGNWTRGSVSSRIENITTAADSRTWLVVDDAAPQSAHTYQGNVYLPHADMFMTLGGGAYQTGGGFQTRNAQGDLVRAGPWMWDPRKADANKVGGTDGSGYDLAGAGGNMWTNRQGNWTGTEPVNYSQNTTAYRSENGQDVVYMTISGTSGFHNLYRYAVGDVRSGGTDQWQHVGITNNAPSGQSAGAIDSVHGLYMHTASLTTWPYDLGVWDLSKSNAANPAANVDTGVALFHEDGSSFTMTQDFGMAFDGASGKLLLWDGLNQGTVWSTQAEFESDGSISSSWTVTELTSTTAAQPGGNFVTGVLGKWQYVAELGAFIALNEFDQGTQDAEVWLYKPFTTAVPEPSNLWLLFSGLALGVFGLRRRGAARA